VFCTKCGKEAREKAAFCSRCGATIPEAQSVSDTEFSQPKKHSGDPWYARCPVCKSGKLAQNWKRAMLGILKTEYFECTCGATLERNGDRWRLTKVRDQSAQAWTNYGNQSLTEEEWKDVADGRISDCEHRESDMKRPLDEIGKGDRPPEGNVGRHVMMQDQTTANDYFVTMRTMQEAISKHDFERAARLARENMRQVPGLVRAEKLSYGSFTIQSIPAFEVGGTLLALVGDDEGLAEMRGIVTSNRDLDAWVDTVEQHEENRRLFTAILEATQQNPGCRQTNMKSLLGIEDGRRVSTLIGWLDKAGKITREKQGSTYTIWLAGAVQAPEPPPQRNVRSHRTDQSPPRMREIDVTRIPYVPLPRSPSRWEEAQVRGAAADVSEPTHYFEVRDADRWEIETIEKIPLEEKPDTAFRQLHPLNSGLLMVDDIGKAEGLGQIPSAALRYGRTGELLAKRPLLHDIYRINVNPLGRGLIAMSRNCVVHAYDDALEAILETTLADAPEIRAIRKRFDIHDDELKNHIRCVALSRNGNCYLFTVVDEAWCVGRDGRGLWGVKLPIKDGWTRMAEPSKSFGTSEAINQALSFMGMSYPFTPEDMKKRYRVLAKQWHPDLNPGDPAATERMKALNRTMQLLTGISENALTAYTKVHYEQEISRSAFDAAGMKFTATASYVVGEIHAADWIYAASFAGCSDAIFLAGYSGRIVVVTESGEPIRVYDIGAVPRRIVDTGDYLYILTYTRLYILRDEALHTIIDTFDGGDLFVAQTGFGLLEKKRFRWFREDGAYLGSIVATDPIRRVYATSRGIAVETRTRRAFIRGAPPWWEEAAT